MAVIEVRISGHEMRATWFGEMHAISRLKAAGIPVRCVFSFRGVDRGTLVRNQSLYTGDLLFRWTDD